MEGLGFSSSGYNGPYETAITADGQIVADFITSGSLIANIIKAGVIDVYKRQEQAVIMLSSHFYESRDGSTGGFFADNVQAGQQVWNTVNLLLRLDREWKV